MNKKSILYLSLFNLIFLCATWGKLYELKPKGMNLNGTEINYTYSLIPLKGAIVNVTQNERNEVTIIYDKKLLFKPPLVFIINDRILDSMNVNSNKVIFSGLSDEECVVIVDYCKQDIRARAEKNIKKQR